jgi:hypothetical protein
MIFAAAAAFFLPLMAAADITAITPIAAFSLTLSPFFAINDFR